MQTPNFFKQISAGIGSPDVINQWMKAIVPSGVNRAQSFTQPSAAWLASVQCILKGSDALRHMQLDAIHNAQKRTSRLASSLAHANGHLAVGKAWQQFSQDNLQNTMEYWTAYREILQDTEIKMLNHAEESIVPKGGNSVGEDPQQGLLKPVKRASARTRGHRKPAVAR